MKDTLLKNMKDTDLKKLKMLMNLKVIKTALVTDMKTRGTKAGL